MCTTLTIDKYGNRTIVVDSNLKKSPMKFVCIYPDGRQRVRIPDYYEMCGNFAWIVFRAKGVKYNRFPEDYKIDDMMVVDLRKEY